MLLAMAMPLCASAQGATEGEDAHFLGIEETDGTSFDFSATEFGSTHSLELKPGQKYALIVSLDDAVGEKFSASELQQATLKLAHPESIEPGEEAQFEVLLSGQKGDASVFLSDKIPFTVSETVTIEPYQYAEGYTVFCNEADEGGAIDVTATTMTLNNSSLHMIELTGQEEQVVFLIAVRSPSETAEETALITVEESEHEPVTPYSTASVVGVFVSIIAITILIVIYRQYDKRRKG